MWNAECGMAVEGRAAGQGQRNGAGHDIPHSALRIPHSRSLLAPEPRRGAAIPRKFHREPARHRVRHGDRAAHARALLSPHDGAGRVGLLGSRRAARRVQRAHRRDRSGAAAGDRPAGRRGAERRAGSGAGEAGGRPRLRLVPTARHLAPDGRRARPRARRICAVSDGSHAIARPTCGVCLDARGRGRRRLCYLGRSDEPGVLVRVGREHRVLFDAVYEGARYPVSAYPGALRFVFVYLIPIAWTTTIPASTLTGRLEPGYALVAAAVAGVAFALTRLLWRTALKRYSGASG